MLLPITNPLPSLCLSLRARGVPVAGVERAHPEEWGHTEHVPPWGLGATGTAGGASAAA